MVLIRLGVVKKVAQMAAPVTAKELSASCGGEEMLIGEILSSIRKKSIMN